MIKIDEQEKTISTSGFKFENWEQINWLYDMLETNGVKIWGVRNAGVKSSATILKLVREEDAT